MHAGCPISHATIIPLKQAISKKAKTRRQKPQIRRSFVFRDTHLGFRHLLGGLPCSRLALCNPLPAAKLRDLSQKDKPDQPLPCLTLCRHQRHELAQQLLQPCLPRSLLQGFPRPPNALNCMRLPESTFSFRCSGFVHTVPCPGKSFHARSPWQTPAIADSTACLSLHRDAFPGHRGVRSQQPNT